MGHGAHPDKRGRLSRAPSPSRGEQPQVSPGDRPSGMVIVKALTPVSSGFKSLLHDRQQLVATL